MTKKQQWPKQKVLPESHLIKRQLTLVLPLIAPLLFEQSIGEIKGRPGTEEAENKRGTERRKKLGESIKKEDGKANRIFLKGVKAKQRKDVGENYMVKVLKIE